MKCLSLHQPWATAIAVGSKLFETRSWKTDYRGPIAIHAAQHARRCDLEDLEADPVWRAALQGEWQPGQLMEKQLPLGAIVAVAELTACVPTANFRHLVQSPKACLKCDHVPEKGFAVVETTSFREDDLGNWLPGRWAWALENIRPLADPYSFRGRQGLFTIPPATLLECTLLPALPQSADGSEHFAIVRKMIAKQADLARNLARR